MRIFYASETTPNCELKSNLWRNNLYLPLVDLGHDVVEFQYDLGETYRNLNMEDPKQQLFINKNRPRLTKELLRQIKAAHDVKPIDLMFTYFYDACVLPEAIDEIRAMGIKTINWYCNGSYQLNLVSQISPHYDWCLVPEKFRLKDYLAMGARPIYCQEAANPNIYKPFSLPVEYDVTFVGQAYGDRPRYIQFLLEQGIDVHVWGFGWQNCTIDAYRENRQSRPKRLMNIGKRLLTAEGWQIFAQRMQRIWEIRSTRGGDSLANSSVFLPPEIIGGTLSDQEMIKMYSRSKINLGFSSCGETHKSGERILQVRLRDFEVPMSGGFYMVEYMTELEEFFNIGKEIVCYSDPGDLAEKVKYYLKHAGERERIRRSGYERCIKDHSWHSRFKSVFTETGLDIS